MVNLAVKIGNLKLKNPVMVASGTFGEEYRELIDIGALGAVVAKTITLKPQAGNPPPRIAETSNGMLNSIGMENKGVGDFVKNKLPVLKKFKIPVIASIAGDDDREFAELAKALDISGADAIEINLSCPNVKHGKLSGLMAQEKDVAYRIVNAVRKATRLTIIAKLSPCVADIAQIAKATKDAGADAALLINTFPAMAVDIDSKKPILGNTSGGLSGPAIKPIALKAVWDVYNRVKIPIIGCGGIMDYRDAIEFILCGASAVQIGTANFINPKTPLEVIAGIKKYLMKNKTSGMNVLVGALKRG